MLLMREAMKRILRLTPFVSFFALSDAELRDAVLAAFDAAQAGLAGRAIPRVVEQPRTTPPASPLVTRVDTTVRAALGSTDDRELTAPGEASELELAAQVALDVVRKTGRVTNMTLREVVPISSDEAREVFQSLVASGRLVRRGVKRGTHYVLPEAAADPAPEAQQEPGLASRRPLPQPSLSGRRETTLRRLLRRAR